MAFITFDELKPFEQLSLLIAVIGVIVTAVYTGITLLLWFTTKKTVELNNKMLNNLLVQTERQIALSHTSSEHKVIDSHRELFLSLVEHPQLLKIFADNSGKTTEVVQRNILGTLFINHTATIYFYHKDNVINFAHFESFIKDARDLFRMGFLRERWLEVKEFHTREFQHFVNEIVLPDEEPATETLKSLIDPARRLATLPAEKIKT